MIHLDFILGMVIGSIEGVAITHPRLWWSMRKVKRRASATTGYRDVLQAHCDDLDEVRRRLNE